MCIVTVYIQGIKPGYEANSQGIRKQNALSISYQIQRCVRSIAHTDTKLHIGQCSSFTLILHDSSGNISVGENKVDVNFIVFQENRTNTTGESTLCYIMHIVCTLLYAYMYFESSCDWLFIVINLNDFISLSIVLSLIFKGNVFYWEQDVNMHTTWFHYQLWLQRSPEFDVANVHV